MSWRDDKVLNRLAGTKGVGRNPERKCAGVLSQEIFVQMNLVHPFDQGKRPGKSSDVIPNAQKFDRHITKRRAHPRLAPETGQLSFFNVSNSSTFSIVHGEGLHTGPDQAQLRDQVVHTILASVAP